MQQLFKGGNYVFTEILHGLVFKITYFFMFALYFRSIVFIAINIYIIILLYFTLFFINYNNVHTYLQYAFSDYLSGQNWLDKRTSFFFNQNIVVRAIL